MSKFAVVTDSTAYIPAEYAQRHNITVAPQVLIWGDETFRDGIDILPGEFYDRLKTAKVMPTTSQISIVDVQAIFQSLVDKGFDVLGIFVSAKLSGTIQSATQAREAMGSAGEKVHIVDSRSTAMGLGLQAITAARAGEAGASVQEAKKDAENMYERSGLYFAVDTLEFLHRGGRIGGGQSSWEPC